MNAECAESALCQGDSDSRTERCACIKVSFKPDRSVNGNKLFGVVTAVKAQSCLIFLFSYELSYGFLLYLFLKPAKTLQRWLFLLPPWHWHSYEFLYLLTSCQHNTPFNLLSNSPRCSLRFERKLDFSGRRWNKSARAEVSVEVADPGVKKKSL